jgi:hypothetical protein
VERLARRCKHAGPSSFVFLKLFAYHTLPETGERKTHGSRSNDTGMGR